MQFNGVHFRRKTLVMYYIKRLWTVLESERHLINVNILNKKLCLKPSADIANEHVNSLTVSGGNIL